jgi:hypothetical protein
MHIIEENKIIEINLELFSFQNEKKEKFLEIWKCVQRTMEEVFYIK